MNDVTGRWLKRGALGSLVVLGVLGAWYVLKPAPVNPDFASGNGRIEATEVDVASKLAGRIDTILVAEGEQVSAGQVLARMDTQALQAEIRQAQAQLQRARTAKLTAAALVAQRESEKITARAVVAQRQAELIATQKRFARTEILVGRNALARQQLDDDRALLDSGHAALAAANSQVLTAQAGIEAAKSQVEEAQASIEAAAATEQRLQADLADTELKAPRDGRVQYRIAEEGEVIPAGGKVLNLVDLSDVYLTFFLPTDQAGRVAIGSEARVIIDAAPQYVIPANISYVASVAQFTPKTVETANEREKLMFRIKARIDPGLLRKHLSQVKTGVPGVAHVRLNPQAQWPAELELKVPQ
ncbi:HlyD family secretion protein [Pseudomonas frederiksbergensis]|uniref:Glycoside hydrolase family 43 n=1 Tax=Pseudomonas frederiksbergensis TaxID=104087 RepID=A0A0B1Z8M6_9PSED|nr:HlyD family efflux transporter periplasmic adaptor subunit [Pseudomonas frederiksbergensis]KHK65536.1 glycoside hydrolase family 43 [Pseudomonas frederiksbergensis]